MMIKLVKPFLFVFLSILITFSCAKEETENPESINDRIFKAYIEINYPEEVLPTKHGIYIVEETVGTGESIKDSAYAYVRYSSRTLKGIYTGTTYDSIAKQLGSYSETSFYGPNVWPIGKDIWPEGMEEVLKMMKIGGKVKAIFPYTQAGGQNTIYDLELDTFVVDIEKYEIELLEDYSKKYYDGLDSLKGYEGFYFKEIHNGGYNEAKDSIPDETVLNIRYTGRFLDGKVFDSNVKDTLLKYNLRLDKDKPLSVTYMKDFDAAKEKNPEIGAVGWLLAIIQMEYQDKAITFFDSSYGYGSGGGGSIPGYYPLFFDIWIDSVPEEEEEDKDKDEDSQE